MDTLDHSGPFDSLAQFESSKDRLIWMEEEKREMAGLIDQLHLENQALKSENAVLELNGIMSFHQLYEVDELSKRSTNHLNSFGMQCPIPSTFDETNVSMLGNLGNPSLLTENRMLKEQVAKLEYVSRLWTRYIDHLQILQQENRGLKQEISKQRQSI